MNQLEKSTVRGVIAAIPYIGGVINEVIAYHDEKYINARLQQLENNLGLCEKTIDDLKERILNFDEHQYYSVRNNIRYLLTEAPREATPPFIRSLLDSIFNDEYSVPEMICEMIKQLNATNINFIKQINLFIAENGDKMEEQYIASRITKKDSLGFRERNYHFPRSTIMWEDFCNLKLPESFGNRTMQFEGLMLINFDATSFESTTVSPEYFNFLGYSLIKMQRLGIIMTEFITTLGTVNPSNINRFHITGFGHLLLGYVKEGD